MRHRPLAADILAELAHTLRAWIVGQMLAMIFLGVLTWIGLVVLGLFAYRRLPIDQFPNVDIPVVTVQTVYPGASPVTIEREVTRRMEEAFNPVEGVDRITSITLEGVSQVIVEFDLGRNGDLASQDIRTKIETIRRELPQDIEPPVVAKFDPAAQPIMSLAISSNTIPLVNLTTIADEQVRRQLESVSGVGEVRLAGGLEREIRVNLVPAQLEALGVTVPEVLGALQRQNMEVPAGRLERGTGEQLVRVMGRIEDPQEFGAVPLRMNADGSVVRATPSTRVILTPVASLAVPLLVERRGRPSAHRSPLAGA